MIMRLRENWISFVLKIDSEAGDDFVMMTEMGFFVQRNPLYRITLPSLTAEKVRAAILTFAKTEDEECMLYPEI